MRRPRLASSVPEIIRGWTWLEARGELQMKLDPIISAVVVGVILGLLVGGWNGPPFGKDGAVEYAHEQR